MRQRPLRGIRLSDLNIGLLAFGVALLLAVLGRWVTIGSNQVFRHAPWVQAVLGAVGLLVTGGAPAGGPEAGAGVADGLGFSARRPGRVGLTVSFLVSYIHVHRRSSACTADR